MEIRQIQSFIMITQEGSFSKAAEILGYSQSAITVQIRLLEDVYKRQAICRRRWMVSCKMRGFL